jgi:hypothetical protein
MTVKTKYDIGDRIIIAGKSQTILAVHIYVSPEKQTERYYLGKQTWLTIHRDDIEGM